MGVLAQRFPLAASWEKPTKHAAQKRMWRELLQMAHQALSVHATCMKMLRGARRTNSHAPIRGMLGNAPSRALAPQNDNLSVIPHLHER